MRFQHTLSAIAMLLTVTAAPVHAAGLVSDARLWGTYHGAAIYCRTTNTDTLGKKAVAYIRRHAATNAEFEAARNAYGLAAIKYARKFPPGEVGGSCAGVREGVNRLLARYAH